MLGPLKKIVLNRHAAIPAVQDALSSRDAKVLKAAMIFLEDNAARVDGTGVERLAALVTDGSLSDTTRSEAAWVLRSCRGVPASLGPKLFPLFMSSKSQQVAAVMAASGVEGLNLLLDVVASAPVMVTRGFEHVGPAGMAVLDRVLALVTHGNSALRATGVSIVGTFSAPCRPAMEALSRLIEDPLEKRWVVEKAVEALHQLESHGKSPRVRAALLHLLVVKMVAENFPDHMEPWSFIQAYSAQGPEALADLDPLADHPSAMVRRVSRSVRSSIRQMTGPDGFADSLTIYELFNVAQRPSRAASDPAAESCAAGRPADALAVTAVIAADASGPAATVAVTLEETIAAAKAGLSDMNEAVRRDTADTLGEFPEGNIRDQGLADILTALVAATDCDAMAEYYIEALGAVDGTLPGVLECLRGCLSHPVERRRWSATHAAEALGAAAAPLLPELRKLSETRLGGQDTWWADRFDPRTGAARAMGVIMARLGHDAPVGFMTGPNMALVESACRLPPDHDLNAMKRWSAAVVSLCKTHAITPRVVEALITGLSSKDYHIRHAAVEGLGSAGGLEDMRSIPALVARFPKERKTYNVNGLLTVILDAVKSNASHRARFASLAAKLPGRYNVFPAKAASIMLWLSPGDERAMRVLIDALAENSFAIECFIGHREATLRAEGPLRALLTSKSVYDHRNRAAAVALAEAGLFDDTIRAGLESGARYRIRECLDLLERHGAGEAITKR